MSRITLIGRTLATAELGEQLDAGLTVPPAATVAEIAQAVKSISGLLDSYTQAATAG